MAQLRVHNFAVSLDGFASGEGRTFDAPFGYEEIGQQLDMSTVTVRGKLARARATVVKEMEVWR